MRIALLDTETSGVSVTEDRIVTCFIGIMEDGQITEEWSWLINPGVEIPQGAIDVHGITNERAQAEGVDPKKAIFEIVQRLDILNRQGLPVVIMNASFDLSLIRAEFKRHYPGAKFSLPDVVIDPYILDKGIDKFRKGKRKLVDLAQHYGVRVEENAHDARADCLMTGRVAFAIGRRSKLPPKEMHAKSIAWAREQQSSLESYLRKKEKDPTLKVQRGWPAYDGEEQDD